MDDATVEAIAKAIYAEGGCCDDCEVADGDSCPSCRKVCLAYARAAIAAMPDPRPTEAEVLEAYNRQHPLSARWLPTCRDLGCFRPEAGDPDA